MLQRKGLGALKLTLGDSLTNFEDSMTGMGSTYRIEGLSLNEEHFRMFGEELKMTVTYSDLVIGKRIGQGACSAVHLAEHEKTGETYAVKMFNVFDKGQRSQMTKEIKVLTELDCEAIISYRGAWYSEGRIGIILEFMDRGSLEFLDDESLDVDEQTVASIVFQILWGLGYLHFDNRLHRDVKPANVLMNSLGHVKVSDFGISTALENTLSSGSNVGSYRYMSPERLEGERYGASADIWSVGLLMVQLWTKIYPFHYACNTPIELLSELLALDISEYLKELKFPQGMHAFLMCMLAPEPVDRLNTEDLLAHPWFASNGITTLEEAQAVVRGWLADQSSTSASSADADADADIEKSNAHAPASNKSKVQGLGTGPVPVGLGRAKSGLGSSFGSSSGLMHSSSGKMDRSGVRAHRSNLDRLLSDDHDADHPLLATPPLSRSSSNSNSNSNSNGNSIKTELSENSFRGSGNGNGGIGSSSNSRNSSSNNLYARSGSNTSNGPSPDPLDSSNGTGGSPSYDRLRSMLPAQKPTFSRAASDGIGTGARGRVSSLDEIEEDPELIASTRGGDSGGGGLAVFTTGSTSGETFTSSSSLSFVGGNKRDRGATLGSTDGTGVSLNTTTQTRSTANFTTGTANTYSDLDLGIVDEEEDIDIYRGRNDSSGDLSDSATGASGDHNTRANNPYNNRHPNPALYAREGRGRGGGG